MSIRSLFKKNFINSKLIVILSVIMVGAYSSEAYQYGTMPKDTYKTAEYPAWKIFFETNQKIKNENDLKLYKQMVENVFNKTNELSEKLSGKKPYEKIVEKYKILQEDIIKIINGKDYAEVEKVRLQVNKKIKPLLGYLSERSNPLNPFFATVSEFSGANRLQKDGLTGRNVPIIVFERYNSTIKPNIKPNEEIKLEMQQFHGPFVYDIIRQISPGADISLEEVPVENPLANFLGLGNGNKFAKFNHLHEQFFLVNLSILEHKKNEGNKPKTPNNIVEFLLAFFNEAEMSVRIRQLIDERVQQPHPTDWHNGHIKDYRPKTKEMFDENLIATFNKIFNEAKPLTKDFVYELILELTSDSTIALNKYNEFFWNFPVFNMLMNRLEKSKKFIPKEFKPSGNIQLSKEEKEKFLFLIGNFIYTADLDYDRESCVKSPGLYSEIEKNFPYALAIQGLGNSFNEPGDFVETNIHGRIVNFSPSEDPVIFSVNINRSNLVNNSSNIPGFIKYLEEYRFFRRSDLSILSTVSTLGSDVKGSLNESNDINFHADFSGTSLSAPATTGGAALIAELFREFGYKESEIASRVQEAILFSANKSFFIPRDGISNDYREDINIKNDMNDVVQCVDPVTTVLVVKSEDLEEVKKLYLANLSPYQKALANESSSIENEKNKDIHCNGYIFFEKTNDGIEIRHSFSLPPSDYKLIKKKEIPLEKLKNNKTPYIFMPAEIYGQGILDLRRAFFYAITMIDNDVNELLENGNKHWWYENETIKKFLESERLSVDLLREIIKSQRQYSEEKRKSIMEEVKKTGKNILIDKFKINNCFDRAHVFKKVMDTIDDEHLNPLYKIIKEKSERILKKKNVS